MRALDRLDSGGPRSTSPSPGTSRLLAAGAVVLLAAPLAIAGQTPVRRLDEPRTGHDYTEVLASGEAHEWPIDALSGEYLQITVESSSDKVAVTVIAPDDDVVADHSEPTADLGIRTRPIIIVTLVAARDGRHRVRVAPRGPDGARYRLRLDDRHTASDRDRQRIAAYQSWADTARANSGSPDARRSAIARYQDALRQFAELDDLYGQAATHHFIGSQWYLLSDAKQGEAEVRLALELWRTLGRDREQGIALSDLGLLAYLAYDHAAARGYYQQALERHRTAADGVGEGTTLTRIGWLHYAAGELQDAVAIAQDALAAYQRAGDRDGESIAFNDLGRAYLDLGDVSGAVGMLRKALELRPPDRDPAGAASVLQRMGLVYISVAEWQRALDVLHQALALSRRAHDGRGETATLVNLGSVYVTFGDTGEGIRYLEPALARARSDAYRGAEGYALLWLGTALVKVGDLTRSRDCLEQAIATFTAGKDVRGQAIALRQLASIQLKLGEPSAALASITRSVETFPRANAQVYTAVLMRADIHFALGDWVSAEAGYEEALGRFREYRARNAEALALAGLGRFRAAQGRYVEARDLLQQAVDIHESLRGRIVDPDLRMSYMSTSFEPYQLAIDVLMALDTQTPGQGFAAAAFHVNERARARGLLDMLAGSGVDLRQGVDPSLLERERTLRWNLNAKAALQTAQLAGKRSSTRLEVLEREIADLSSALRETTTRIRQESPAYASFIEPQPVAAVDAGRMLDTGTVLLEYAFGESRGWLYAVTPTGFDSFAIASRHDIEEAAREVHRLLAARQPVAGEAPEARRARIERADVELVARMRALSNLLLGPVARSLAGEWRGRRLAIVAGGVLEYIPFGALPVPGSASASGEPLIAFHEIVALPSASSLALLRTDAAPPAPGRKTIAVIADPVFTADDPRVRRTAGVHRAPASKVPEMAMRGGDPGLTPAADAGEAPAVGTPATRSTLARLPFSRAEALAVASQVPGSALLQATDFDATLALATSGRLRGYRIVHFATHGLIDTVRPGLSGLALSMVDADGRSRDGILRLNTIYNLRLDADLVVLSACQTALGKEVAGEGLVGLTRGFMYAGAKRVIASLWQVSDVATAELMKRFYEGLLRRGLPAAAALREAQREMSRDQRWSAPYFWAGFVLQGDWSR